jgi:hypothetical protein
MKSFNLSLNNFISTFGVNLGKEQTQTNWVLKRIVLNVVWAVFNFGILLFVYKLVSSTMYEYVFMAVSVLYCLMYWIIATTIFDKLIGDEIDNLEKEK